MSRIPASAAMTTGWDIQMGNSPVDCTECTTSVGYIPNLPHPDTAAPE